MLTMCPLRKHQFLVPPFWVTVLLVFHSKMHWNLFLNKSIPLPIFASLRNIR